MKRSAKALARGERIGVRMIWMPSDRKTSSKTRSELGGSVPDLELDWVNRVGEHHGAVAGLLDNPRSGRVSRDPHHVDPSGVELNEEQDVEPLQRHRVDGEEVAGQRQRRLASKELIPAGPRPHRRWIDVVPLEGWVGWFDDDDGWLVGGLPT